MKLREDVERNVSWFVAGEIDQQPLSVNDLTYSSVAQAPVTFQTFMALVAISAKNFEDNVSGSSSL